MNDLKIHFRPAESYAQMDPKEVNKFELHQLCFGTISFRNLVKEAIRYVVAGIGLHIGEINRH